MQHVVGRWYRRVRSQLQFLTMNPLTAVCNMIAFPPLADPIVSTFPTSESIKNWSEENHEQLPVHCIMPPKKKDSRDIFVFYVEGLERNESEYPMQGTWFWRVASRRMNKTLFISFKCTSAENIYLFIISECHLRIFFLLSNYLTHFWFRVGWWTKVKWLLCD